MEPVSQEDYDVLTQVMLDLIDRDANALLQIHKCFQKVANSYQETHPEQDIESVMYKAFLLKNQGSSQSKAS